MRPIALLLLCLAAAPLLAQEFPGDPGPPYTFHVSDLVLHIDDLVFRIDDLGTRIEALTVKETDTELRVDLAADVLFAFDQADLLPQAEETLHKAAAFVKERNKAGTVRIEGHTDAKGSDPYNQKLSLRRADSVKQWFQTHGLAALRFKTAGLGAKHPIAPNQKPDGTDDPEGRQKNRRVEIVITK